MNQNQTVHVIGAGLAGVEAAYQVAKNGINVKLYEMRPVKMTPAHHKSDIKAFLMWIYHFLLFQ